MRKVLAIPLLTIGALAVAAAPAYGKTLPQREAGLWEIKIDRDSDLGSLTQEIEAMLEQVPAEHREQMKEMMQQSDLGPSGKTTLQECITPEMAAEELSLPLDDPDAECTHKLDVVSSSEAKFTFSCKSSDGNWDGEGRVWDWTPKSHQGQFLVKGQFDGHDVTMDIKQQARWLDSDCGDVLPEE